MGSEGEHGDPEEPSDREDAPTQAVIDQLEEHQTWVAARFEELGNRLDRIEARLDSGSTEGDSGRGKGKQGMSRQEVLAIRATKKRARRAAELKAKHESSPDAGEKPAAG